MTTQDLGLAEEGADWVMSGRLIDHSGIDVHMLGVPTRCCRQVSVSVVCSFYKGKCNMIGPGPMVTCIQSIEAI